MATYTISVLNITRTSADFYMEIDGEAGAGAMDFKIYVGSTVVKTISSSDPGWSASTITVTGLDPGTSYVAKLDQYPTVTESFTTLADNPKIALESQWEDLATRIKAKAESTDIPTVNNSTITITNNGTTVDTFTTNASADKTIALSAPVITMSATDPGEGVALEANHFIAVFNPN